MMSRHPTPARKDHQVFCRTEGWTQVRNSTGRTGHQFVYELALPDGRMLRTRISHPVGRDTYGASIWSHILRDQLDVTEDEFWDCVRGRAIPERGAPAPSAAAIPAGVVSQLLAHGVGEAEIRDMTKGEAIGRLNDLWTRPSDSSGEGPRSS